MDLSIENFILLNPLSHTVQQVQPTRKSEENHVQASFRIQHLEKMLQGSLLTVVNCWPNTS